MTSLSQTIWISLQAGLLFLFFLVCWYFIKTPEEKETETFLDHEPVKSIENVMDIMEPLITDSEATAKRFEKQIREKKKIIQELDKKLETRITHLTLLMNQADARLAKISEINSAPESYENNQETILSLYQKGWSPTAISEKLAMPEQEVRFIAGLQDKSIPVTQQTRKTNAPETP